MLWSTFFRTRQTKNNPFNNKEFAKSYFETFQEYQAFFTAFSLPIYAFISWIVFLNRKKYNFYEHLVIYLYTTAQLSIFTFLLVTPILIINQKIGSYFAIGTSVFMFLYYSFALIRLFKLTFWQFIVKSLYFVFVSGVLYIIGITISLIFILIFSGPGYFKQLINPPAQDSIQKVEKKLDSIQLQPNDSLKHIQVQDSVKKDPKSISFYEASSKLNCLS